MGRKIKYYKRENNNPKTEDVFYIMIKRIGMCVEFQNTTGVSRVIPKGTVLTNLIPISEKKANKLYEKFLNKAGH